MKAQVFYKAEDMRFEDVDMPQLKENEVLIKVKACGICGSDIAYYYGKSPIETKSGIGPLILGHEFSGEIVEIGEIPKSLNLFKAGDRVAANPVQYCNSCRMCARANFNLCENARVCGVSVNGAFAEFTAINYNNLIKIPDDVSYEQAALIEPLSCATYAVMNANILLGDFVTVVGPGPIGLMMVQLAKAAGAGKIALIGRRDYPLEMGKKVGVDYLLNIHDKNSRYYSAYPVDDIVKLTDNYMSDRVIVATSSEDAAQLSLKISGKKSTVVFFGLGGAEDTLNVPMLDTLTSDKRLVFSWLAPLVWPIAIKAISNGKVKLDDIITHKFNLAELVNAIEFMKNSKENKLKGIIVSE